MQVQANNKRQLDKGDRKTNVWLGQAIACALILATTSLVAAKTTITNSRWDLCIKYKVGRNTDDSEFVVQSNLKGGYLDKHAVALACYSKTLKSIEIISLAYRNKKPAYTTRAQFYSFGGQITFETNKNRDNIEIPKSLFITDFDAIFYDGAVTESEIETYMQKVLPELLP
ncbi:hypothetical protein [Dendronalium sp. ChiSLP03b]|uniref:hypothetical protein n=1 Tax=Dendronalium sp. ChiSLP03b TaxID=3075381 RepID=UPI00391AB5C1